MQKIEREEDAIFRDTILQPIKDGPTSDWTSQRVFSVTKNIDLGFEFTHDTVIMHLKVIRKDGLIELSEVTGVGFPDYTVELTEEGREFLRTNQSYQKLYFKGLQEEQKSKHWYSPLNNWLKEYNPLVGTAFTVVGVGLTVLGLWMTLGSNERKTKIKELQFTVDSLKSLSPVIVTDIVLKTDTVYIKEPSK